jgi:hypothetical protein
MAKSYSEKQKYVSELFNYEESHNIPNSMRLTYDPYKDVPEIPDPAPSKKAYVDIREIVNRVKNLKYLGEL